MSTGTESTYPAVYDLIGIGFGPSNIAISGALVEKWTAPSNDAETSFQKILFIEKHPSFQWHPGMLLPGAQMQISFMKDLATLRSPQSPLTFVNYLHNQGRLSAFINRGSLTPSRKEFADYLEWAARYVEAQGVNVKYGQEVVAIDESMDGLITVTSITLADGKLNSFITRNLVVSPGGRARIPNVVAPFIKEPSIVARSTLLHSSEYKHRIGELLESITSERQRPLRIAVIGGGQSAAEVTMNLQGLLNDIPAGDGPIGHQVDMLLRKGSLKPSDDTPFSNEIFDPEVTNDWFSTSEQGRERIMAEYKATNYSVVNPRTIDALYEIIYDQQVDEAIVARNSTVFTPRPRIIIRSHMHIPSLKYDTGSKKFVFTFRNVRTREVFENESYDAVVCATGYQRNSWTKMLRASDRLGKRFGIDDSASEIPIKLVPFVQRVADTVDLDQPQDSPLSSVSSTPTSVVTTPPISPGAENVVKQESSPTEAVKLYITRNYRLLPMASTKTMQDGSAEGLKARIYIQGLEESTHGLSDTLLSVVSCRAGEVVDDLLNDD
ncbi:putative L-ornithine-N5-monooxygenase [Lentinula aff. lateritia]|uniref:L-ornithine-N5-monooxygenase n=1 Tax=Lentinula aff. lateritia TaxID=2804960 RepID=A0ACC1U7I9_9AGAR|nr:putative L-ornithine-N5-monooxygenase [Lentinula aff. lateritia]